MINSYSVSLSPSLSWLRAHTVHKQTTDFQGTTHTAVKYHPLSFDEIRLGRSLFCAFPPFVRDELMVWKLRACMCLGVSVPTCAFASVCVRG